MKTTKRKCVSIINLQDFKDRAGLWVACFSKTIEGVDYNYTTRAGKLYSAAKKRTKLA